MLRFIYRNNLKDLKEIFQFTEIVRSLLFGKDFKVFRKKSRSQYDNAKDRNTIRKYIYERVNSSGKIITHENRLRVTLEIFKVIERKFLSEDVEIIKAEIDKEIDRCLDDFGYLSTL